MGCGCKQAERTPLWTEVPDFAGSSERKPGENVDCYAQRANVVAQDDNRTPPPNTVENSYLTSDLDGNVDEQFALTPNSSDVVTDWRIWTDKQSGPPPGLAFDQNAGTLKGQVPPADRDKNYKVEAKAFGADKQVIDAKEYNFYPKTEKPGETIKFVNPYQSSKPSRISSGFGERSKASTGGKGSTNHKGIDMANGGGPPANIVSAADGTVTRVQDRQGGYGKNVTIEHRDANGTLVATTKYAHLNDMYVKQGDKVAAGQSIGQEGNTGSSTGKHLHFELMDANGKQVDPVPYINGDHKIAVVADDDHDHDNDSDEQYWNTPYKERKIRNAGMTTGEGNNAKDCPSEIPGQYGSGPQPTSDNDSPSSNQTGGQASDQKTSEPPTVPISSNPDKAATQREIQRALDEDPSLTAEDKKHLMFVAGIESGYKPDAKNPNSSARGSFQMLDKTANKYYGDIGYPNPTEAQRNDPYLATKAQAEFYKKEQKPYWDGYQASGGTTIAGKPLSADTQARYSNLSQNEFTYGLIHHDGVGNAVKGSDKGGVDYYRTKVRQAT